MSPMVTRAQINSLKPFKEMRAIVVGVSDYRSEKIADLPFADDDARYFAQMLEEQTEWPVDPQNITLLLNEEATYGRFIAELNELVSITQPRDRILIFFAGHGDVETVSDRKAGYLLFHDAPEKTYAAGGACEVNTLDEKISELILKRDAQVILVADACRSGSLAGSESGGSRATAAAMQTLFGNTVKLLSCEPEESSLEDPQLAGGHGLFSYYLVQGMLGAANKDDDAFVDLLELERYVQDRVLEDSDSRQTPNFNGPRRLKIAKASSNNPAINNPLNRLPAQDKVVVATAAQAEMNQFLAFSKAVQAGHLMLPYKSSALELYETMADSPEGLAFRQAMKTTLISELQKEAQKAISDYTTSPGRELNKRWANSEVYENYPAYLEKAASLLETEDCFYADIMARAHYFRGVNLRLAAEAKAADSTAFLEALIQQEKALELLCTATAPHIYNEIGLIQQALKHNTPKMAAFEKAVQQSPRWGLALTNLARAHKDAGRTDEAERLYLKAIEVDPDLSLTYYNLGYFYDQLDEVKKSIEYYRLSIEKPDPLPEAMYNLSRRYYIADTLIDEGISLMNRYTNLQPYDVYGYHFLGLMNRKSGKMLQAADAFEFALALAPNDPYILREAGTTNFHRQDFVGAIQLWERLLNVAPDNSEPHLWIAQTYIELDQPQKAMYHLKHLLEKGYTNYENIQYKDYFADLKNNPEYQVLMERYFPEKE